MAYEGAQRAIFLNLPKNRNIDIEFKDLTLTVPSGRKASKQIIKGVSGKFKSGELTAIMGPSGAGKTSLLNVLTGFQTNGITGTVKSGDGPACKNGASQYKKEACYILQDDQLEPLFTVQEIMRMAANLKLGHSISKKSKEFLIDDILDTLGLLTCKDTRCKSLSGGQKKRLSIALELIDNPPIMFLDEPTTGLDSSSSLQCISMLKGLAHGGRAIVCTIHQPSATIYEMFDQVYVMAEGKCIYQGASLNTVPYLASVGFNCPQYHNPADYLLEVANGEYGLFTDLLAKAATDTQWRNSVTPKYELEDQTNELVIKEYDGVNGDGPFTKGLVLITPPSEWVKFGILVKRAFLQIYRDWTLSYLKLLLHLIVSLILGLTYFKFGNDASKTVSNVGFYLVGIIYLSYTSLMPAVLKFPSEVAVIRKERFNNWYRLKTYYAAFLVTDIPLQVIFSLVYHCGTYFLSDQPREWFRFFMVFFVLVLVNLTASSIGLVFGTTVNPVNGTFLAAILIACLLLVAGFLILFSHMSRPMYCLSYLSFLSYAMEALVQAIYSYERPTIPCPEEEMYCHYQTPKEILKIIGMAQGNYWADVAFLVCSIIVFRVVAFCTLKKRLSS